jgi:predicted RNA-binding protein
MCESKVYLATDDGEQLVLDDVTMIRPEQGGYRLVNLFGEQRQIQCRIREIDLLRHRIVMEPVPDEPAMQE